MAEINMVRGAPRRVECSEGALPDGVWYGKVRGFSNTLFLKGGNVIVFLAITAETESTGIRTDTSNERVSVVPARVIKVEAETIE